MRKQLRKLKQQLIRLRLTEKPILIFGLRRGGSTLVADMVASERGVWFADEPYAIFPNRPAYKLGCVELPRVQHSAFFDLSPTEIEMFSSYSNKLLSGRLRQLGTCRHTLNGMLANRVALKILNANWMLHWFVENVNASILTLIRHPGAQAVSVLRQKWGFQLEAFAANERFLYENFSQAQVAVIKDSLLNKDHFMIALLDWIVTSQPLRKTQNEKITRVTYEDIVTLPEDFVSEVLVGKFGLSENKALLSVLKKPSGSSRMSTDKANRLISQGETEALLNFWKKDVDKEVMARAQNVLELFEIDHYRFA